MHTPQNSLPTKRSSAAFSLVEVVMALGIFSFGIVSLLGLATVSLDTHQSSKQETVLTQIKQRLTAEILLTDGEKLADLAQYERMFDAEGREISDTETPVVYRAQIELSQFIPPGGSDQDVSASLQRALLFAFHDPSGERLKGAVQSGLASGSLLVSKAESAQPSSNP